MPFDQFGRRINYLRLSVTDRCNLRCVYCMPLNGLSFLPSRELLSPGEIEEIARAAVSVGFTKFRLTGGEPTLRHDIVEIVERLAAVPGAEDLAMTTNGILLPELAKPLASAGLRRVNIHLDALEPKVLERIMRWGRLEDIWRGIQAAEEAHLTPIKLNSVITRGFNDAEVVSIARLTVNSEWHCRFIEMMPFGVGECSTVARTKFVSNTEVRRLIEAALGPLTPVPGDPSDESKNYRLPGARGVIGFISPVSDPYCGTCNRMRVTADGKLHLCLLNDDEIDLRQVLHRGDHQALRDLLCEAVTSKPIGHRLEQGVSTQNRRMFQIGG